MHWFFGVDLIQDRRSGMEAVLACETVVLDPVYRVVAALIPALQAHPEAETIFAALLYLGTTEGDMVMCARNKDRLPRGWRSRWEFADKLEGRLPAVGDALYDRWVATVDDMPRPHYEAEPMRDFLGDPNIGGSIDSFPVACHRKLGKKQKRVRLFKVNPHYHAGVKGQAISKVIFRVNNRGLFADLRGPLFPQHDKYLLADSGMLETLATDPKLRNFLWLGDTHIIGPMMVTPFTNGQLLPIFEHPAATAARIRDRREIVAPTSSLQRLAWIAACAEVAELHRRMAATESDEEKKRIWELLKVARRNALDRNEHARARAEQPLSEWGMSRFPRFQQWSKSSALLRAALRFAAAIINMETRLVHMEMLGRDGRYKFKQDAEWMQRAVEKSSLLEFQLEQKASLFAALGDRPAPRPEPVPRVRAPRTRAVTVRSDAAPRSRSERRAERNWEARMAAAFVVRDRIHAEQHARIAVLAARELRSSK